jgi:hypothetical protein
MLVHTTEALPFTLLRPAHTPPRDPRTLAHHGIVWDPSYLGEILPTITGPCVVDVETRGTQAWKGPEENYVVGLGLAWADGCIYMPIKDWTDTTAYGRVLEWLVTYQGGLVAHNATFENSWIWRDSGGRHPNWYVCTYSAYKHAATEGFLGQKWSLKSAQLEVLLWPATNQVGIDAWLVEAGHVTGREGNQADYSQLWQVPSDILGEYCMLDCESTWLLMDRHLRPLWDEFPIMLEYEQQDIITLIRIITEQVARGIQLDIPALREYAEYLRRRCEETRTEFLTHEGVAKAVALYYQRGLAEMAQREPPRYRKQRVLVEPKMYTKTGKINKGWIKWSEAIRVPPVERLDWQRWRAKMDLAEAGGYEPISLNVASTKDLIWLLFDPEALDLTPVLWTDNEDNPQPATSAEALLAYGEVGRLLSAHREVIKELGYVDSYLTLADGEGVLHPEWKVPGTVTGRLAGKEPNLQQLPRTYGLLRTMIPRPGHVWVDYDLASIEDVILAEFSRDESMMAIYGPEAKPNDGYLYIGSRIKGLREAILATGYDPDNPTSESIAAAKRGAKKERSIAKSFKLACIAAGSPVRVRGRGFIPIQKVVPGDHIWDGTQWTPTDGPIDKGVRSCYPMGEVIRLTEDHPILGVDNEWRQARSYLRTFPEGTNTPQQVHSPAATWTEVWQLGSYLLRGLIRSVWISLCARLLSTHSENQKAL